MKTKNHRKINIVKIKGFTLVELIVVITILVILGTIALINLGGFASSARDSRRVSDMSNITQSIELSVVTQGSAPIPTNPISYTGGSVTIQAGIINNSTLPRMSGDFSDPVTKAPYNYSVFGNGLYYQIGIDFENPLSFTPSTFGRGLGGGLIDTVYADSAVKYSKLSGSYKFDPSLPSLFFLTGAQNTASGGIFSPDVCFVLNNVSTNTFASPIGCKAKKDMNLKDMDSSLVGYWDMETLTGTMLKDLSGNGNDGVFSGSMSSTGSLTGGILGMGRNFNGSGYIEINDSQSLNIDNVTILALIEYKDFPLLVGNVGIVEKTFTGVIVPYYQYKLGLTSNGHSMYPNGAISGSFSVKNTYNIASFKQNNSFLMGEKILLATSFDGNFVKIYKNGLLLGKQELHGNLDKYPTKLCFGKTFCSNSNGGQQNFYGTIDDIKIYNRALSDDEIKQQAKIAGF